MFALVAVYPDGNRELIDFVSSPADAEKLAAKVVAINGEERIRELGIRFNVELAI